MNSCAPEPHFHLFPKLPTEVRFEIWRLSLPDTRVFRIRSKLESHMAPILMEYNHQPPTALKICRESRQVALKEGKFLFGPCNSSSIGGLWFNPVKDILFFPSHPIEGENKDGYLNSYEILRSLSRSRIFVDHVRHVAVDRHAGNNWLMLGRTVTLWLAQCTTLFVTMDHSVPGSGQDVTPYILKKSDHLPPILPPRNQRMSGGTEDEWPWDYYLIPNGREFFTCDEVSHWISEMYYEDSEIEIKHVRGLELYEVRSK